VVFRVLLDLIDLERADRSGNPLGHGIALPGRDDLLLMRFEGLARSCHLRLVLLICSGVQLDVHVKFVLLRGGHGDQLGLSVIHLLGELQNGPLVLTHVLDAQHVVNVPGRLRGEVLGALSRNGMRDNVGWHGYIGQRGVEASAHLCKLINIFLLDFGHLILSGIQVPWALLLAGVKL
jgi:hypothetical protein